VLDEIQRVPELLNEVHRLIEARGLRFAMTGSSARKLRRGGVNLLAGRARTLRMHPLTALELGRDFDLERALRYGSLPFACTTDDPASYLRDYVGAYLREEVQQECLVREIGGFARFLEGASFSQGAVLNVASVARECSVHAKVAESHFTLLEDLLIAMRLPVFTRRAKRRVIAHPKFYFFDAGVYRALRPKGPLDSGDEVDGAALETLFLANLRAVNDAFDLGYEFHYWRTGNGLEVDFVLYGERGLVAFEVKRSARVRDEDLAGLLAFRSDYPMARAYFVHPGSRRAHHRGVEILPMGAALKGLDELLGATRRPPTRSAKVRKRRET
jgi:predicted AAA+ superfamily ATPase